MTFIEFCEELAKVDMPRDDSPYLRFSGHDDEGIGFEHCPITAVSFHQSGEAFSIDEAVTVGVNYLCLSHDAASAIVAIADREPLADQWDAQTMRACMDGTL